MRGKEFFKSILLSFFIIVTLINIAMFVLGSIFQPELRFGYNAFLSPLIYGFISIIPCMVMYSKKELTVKKLIIRKIIQLLSIEGILGLLVFGFQSPQKENTQLMISFSISIFVIYVLEHLISWLLDVQTAKRMTEDLQHYQDNWKSVSN